MVTSHKLPSRYECFFFNYTSVTVYFNFNEFLSTAITSSILSAWNTCDNMNLLVLRSFWRTS